MDYLDMLLDEFCNNPKVFGNNKCQVSVLTRYNFMKLQFYDILKIATFHNVMQS